MAIAANAHTPASQVPQDRAVLVADVCFLVEQLKQAVVTELMDFISLIAIIAPLDHGNPPRSTWNPPGKQLLKDHPRLLS